MYRHDYTNSNYLHRCCDICSLPEEGVNNAHCIPRTPFYVCICGMRTQAKESSQEYLELYHNASYAVDDPTPNRPVPYGPMDVKIEVPPEMSGTGNPTFML